MPSSSEHWDRIFSTTQDAKLGWYEKDLSKTFELLSKIPNWKSSTIFLPGAGTSLLIEELLSQDVNLVLNDISLEALNKVKSRLRYNKNKIVWNCQDISKSLPEFNSKIDIWIDRAVLHFLLEDDEINGYFENVISTVKTNGYAIFAEFSKKGAAKCAGLKLHRYSIEELSERLGSTFMLEYQFEDTYINPFGGKRPYIYTLFKKKG